MVYLLWLSGLLYLSQSFGKCRVEFFDSTIITPTCAISDRTSTSENIMAQDSLKLLLYNYVNIKIIKYIQLTSFV